MEYEVMIECNLQVEMRDGVVLLADLYRPARDGSPVADPFPTILVRTSYDKGLAQRYVNPHYLVQHGYTVVFQDVRGRYKSEGDYYHGIYETEDGYDTIEWIAQQPWSNGKVGMTGVSYLAAVQCAAAISGAPHLASIFHVKAPSDYYQDGFRRGGTLLMYFVPIIFMFSSTSKEALADPILLQSLTRAYERDGAEWLRRFPLKPGLTPVSRVPDAERWYVDMVNHTDYDTYWKEIPLWQPIEFLDVYADVPGYYIGGWYDLYREETFYPLLADRQEQPVKLMMGPWTHLDRAGFAGDVDFGSEATMSDEAYNALQLWWFDQTLKAARNGVLDEPPVKVFVMGGGGGRKNKDGRMQHGGHWRFENEWPLARTQYTNYYLYPNNVLNPAAPVEPDSSSTYIYDPRDPAPTIGGTSYFLEGRDPETGYKMFVPYGPQDQREHPDFFGCQSHLPLSSRQDVLVFQTPPLAEDVEVTGPLVVKLWAKSSAVDTDFTAKLIDVYPPNEDYPDGYAMNLADSILRARYRNGFEEAELMQPGEIYSFSFELPPTSNLFKQGHRIRLDISSSNYPTYDPNPNTGEPYMTAGRYMVAENTLYHDAAHPSHIVLPIIPASDGAPAEA